MENPERPTRHPGSCASKPLPLGRVVVTSGVSGKLTDAVKPLTDDGDLQVALYNDFIKRYLSRHATGDWGDLCEEDNKANEVALDPAYPTRILSVYNDVEYVKGVGSGDRMYIITEWDRSVTTFLFPSEY